MTGLTSYERDCVEQAMAAQGAMLANVEAWAAINSGSRNLEGLARLADAIGAAFSVLPGAMERVDPVRVEAVNGAGERFDLPHGQHLFGRRSRFIRSDQRTTQAAQDHRGQAEDHGFTSSCNTKAYSLD